MKTLTGILFLLLAQSAQATATPESVIKLQITSLDAHLADTAHQSVVIDATESQWLNKSERVLVELMTHNKALSERLHNGRLRHDLLQTIYYEAKRAGLEPDLVLSVIRVESNFRKYAISSAGARGFMQVMPMWANIVGETSSDLFNLRTNLRLGCAILRSYLDKEQGNIHRALARYNGSLGKNDYPNLIPRFRIYFNVLIFLILYFRGKSFIMLVADVLTGSQIIGFTAIKFNRLGKSCRAPRGRVD